MTFHDCGMIVVKVSTIIMFVFFLWCVLVKLDAGKQKEIDNEDVS